MINFKKLKNESNEKKWDSINQKKEEDTDYNCFWSEGSKCKFCTHAQCLFDSKWQEKEKLKQNIINKEIEKIKNKKYEEMFENSEYLKKWEMIIDEIRGY